MLLHERWDTEGPAPPRQQPGPGSQRGRAGPKGCGTSPAPLHDRAAPASGWLACGSVLTRALLAAVVAGAGALGSAFEPVAAAPGVIPFAVAGFVLATRGLPAAPGVRCVGLVFGAAFYFILHLLAAGGRAPAPGSALSTLEALFYGRAGLGAVRCSSGTGCGRSGSRAAWVAVEVVAQRLPLGGMPGAGWRSPSSTPRAPARCRTSATVGVSFLLALLGALLAWARRRARSRAGRALGRWRLALVGLSRCSPCPRCCRGTAPADAAADRRRGAGRRARRRRRHPLRLPAGHPATTSTRPSTWPRRSTAGGRAAARLRRCGRRTPPPSTPSTTPRPTPTSGGQRGDRRADPGRRDRRRRARTTCSTRASSGTRRPARATGTPSGTRCRSASTSRCARCFGSTTSSTGSRDRRATWCSGTRDEPLDIAGTRGRRRDLLRRRLRRRAPRPRCATGRRAAGRADQQRDVHPHRPDRPAVRDHPAAGDRDRPLRRGRRRPTASPGSIAPDGQRRRRRRAAHPGGARRARSALTDALTPAVRIGPWPGRLAARADAARGRCWRCSRIVGRAARGDAARDRRHQPDRGRRRRRATRGRAA